jgi:hypothetical protein
MGGLFASVRSGGGLNCQVSRRSLRGQSLAKRSENYDAWLFVEHSSAKARREKAPDD